MDTPFLSICIPTYNRNKRVLETLQALLPLLTGECELVVVDNCSDVPVEPAVRALVEERGGLPCPWRVVRNAINIGLSGNVLRCLELAQGHWVIVTGDDDTPLAHFVESLIARAKQFPQAVCVNFGAPVPRTIQYETRGRAEMLERMDCLGNFTFLSSNLYRRSAICTGLRWGYTVSALCPHLTALLMSVGEEDQVVVVPEGLVSSPTERGWSVMLYTHCMGGMLDLPMTLHEKRTLSRLMLQWPSYSMIFYMLADDREMPIQEKLYHFDHIVFKRLSLCGTRGERRKMGLYRLFLKYPRLLAAFQAAKQLVLRDSIPLRQSEVSSTGNALLKRL